MSVVHGLKTGRLLLDGNYAADKGIYEIPIDGTEPTAEAKQRYKMSPKDDPYPTVTTTISDRAYGGTAYEPKGMAKHIAFLHAAAGYPTKTTWIKAIDNNNYLGWPGLTAQRVRRFLTVPEETVYGHLHMIRQGIRPTKAISH